MAGRITLISCIIFVASLAMFSLARTRFIRLDDQGTGQALLLAGDEPAYLLIAHSLVTDGDFNLYNNCAARDGRSFGMERAGPHAARRDLKKREVYSIHTPGVSILVAPAYALALRLGVSPRAAVCVFMNFLAALLAVNVRLFCRDLSRLAGCASPWPALLSTAAVMLTPPVVFYANLVYPELPAALFILYAFRHAFPRAVSFDPGSPNRRTGEPANRRNMESLTSPTRPLAHSPSQFLSSLCVAFLPWLSFRFFLPSFVLAALLVRRGRAVRSTRRWFAFSLTLPLLASLALFLAYQYRAFGSVNPAAGYIAQDFPQRGISLSGFLTGASGLLLDRSYGLLAWSPVYILSLFGIARLFRERRNIALPLMLLSLAVFLPGAHFIHWWGGFAPPGRFLVAVTPLLGGALCFALAGKPRPSFTALFFLLLAASLLFGCLGCLHPSWLYRRRHPLTNYRHLGPLIEAFPNLMRPTRWTRPLAAIWAVALVLVNGFFAVAGDFAGQRHRDASFKGGCTP